MIASQIPASMNQTWSTDQPNNLDTPRYTYSILFIFMYFSVKLNISQNMAQSITLLFSIRFHWSPVFQSLQITFQSAGGGHSPRALTAAPRTAGVTSRVSCRSMASVSAPEKAPRTPWIVGWGYMPFWFWREIPCIQKKTCVFGDPNLSFYLTPRIIHPFWNIWYVPFLFPVLELGTSCKGEEMQATKYVWSWDRISNYIESGALNHQVINRDGTDLMSFSCSGALLINECDANHVPLKKCRKIQYDCYVTWYVPDKREINVQTTSNEFK